MHKYKNTEIQKEANTFIRGRSLLHPLSTARVTEAFGEGVVVDLQLGHL